MPPPKKAAKKTPAKSAPKHDEGKDMRRAHEHKGRVEVLRPSLGKSAGYIDTLIELAARELADSHARDAADLLRAAEHLSFGYLASSKPDPDAHPALSKSFEEEFDHKLEKAEEHWEESDALSEIYEKALQGARKAFQEGTHHKALELARAAEALAHVHLHVADES